MLLTRRRAVASELSSGRRSTATVAAAVNKSCFALLLLLLLLRVPLSASLKTVSRPAISLLGNKCTLIVDSFEVLVALSFVDRATIQYP